MPARRRLAALRAECGRRLRRIDSFLLRSVVAKGKGASTPSQTAWGLIGLLAVVGPDDPAVERAVGWLRGTQNEDGSWDEKEFTGTGFPCVFYLKYHLYRNSFPLYALARYDNMRKGKRKIRWECRFRPKKYSIRTVLGGNG